MYDILDSKHVNDVSRDKRYLKRIFGPLELVSLQITKELFLIILLIKLFVLELK
jgi:hypothetical protein